MAASDRSPEHPHVRPVAALAGVVIALVLLVGCSSSGDRPTLPSLSTTTTDADGGGSTTTTDRTTTTTDRTTTTTTERTTTTTEPRTTTTTEPRTTTTTEPRTTTTEGRATTTTAESTTTTGSELAANTTGASESDVPWLAIAALAALAILMVVIALRRRSERKDWWAKADGLVRDGRALVDLGTAGPAGADPQQQVAHWGTLEQRTQALATEVQVVLGSGPPDDHTRAAVAGLGQAVADYLGSLRTSRTLRIGPPAPTAEQLQFADAESNQRLAVVRANLDQLDQLVVPHRAAVSP